MKGPARTGSGSIQTVIGIGNGLTDEWLKSQTREDLRKILDHLSQPINVAINRQLIRRLQEMYLGISALEGLNEGLIEHVRIQTFTVISILEALNKHGDDFDKNNHPIYNNGFESTTEQGA